jgi:hypothetical protein
VNPETEPFGVFQERTVPSGSKLAGWAALVRAFKIQAPVRNPSCVAELHVRGSQRDSGGWTVFDLLIFKRLCDASPADAFAEMVRAAPTGNPSRRTWYLYEHLTGRTLDVGDAPAAAAIDVLDPARYFTGAPRLSRRHRVRDNLLGDGRFCPIIRRTKALTEFIELDLASKALETVGRTGAHLIARAASFMLLADSRASFEIEGERPPRNRLERWGRAVLQAGKHPLTLDEILRLQRILIEDTRFINPGLRPDGVFIGERDQQGDPLPEFIGARPDDLQDLISALLAANDRMREDGLDAVLKAAATAFGFVYIHPFQDGNGRMHRCLIHHVLAERKFAPPGMVFPVSSVMLDRIEDYRTILQSHSGLLMPYIDWRATFARNVEVLNDTADLYRYFDATAAAEFLYACVRRTVEQDLPREIDYLARHDEAMRRIMEAVEMPDRIAEDLVMFIRQNNGALSKKRREGEFKALTDDEVMVIEGIVSDAFAAF